MCIDILLKESFLKIQHGSLTGMKIQRVSIQGTALLEPCPSEWVMERCNQKSRKGVITVQIGLLNDKIEDAQRELKKRKTEKEQFESEIAKWKGILDSSAEG